MTEKQRSKLAELGAALASMATLPGGAAVEVRDAGIELKRELHLTDLARLQVTELVPHALYPRRADALVVQAAAALW